MSGRFKIIFFRRKSVEWAGEWWFELAAAAFFAGAQAVFAGNGAATNSFAVGAPAPLPRVAASPAAPSGNPVLSTNSFSGPVGTAFAPRPGWNSSVTNAATGVDPFVQKLEQARYGIKTRQFQDAEPLLVSLLSDGVPPAVQKEALLELAALAESQDNLPRAQQIYAQFFDRWPQDTRVPEVLLRQGRLFRRMGLNDLALTKFYAVMTAALTLKSDRLDYYEHLVAQAQWEIAQTHFRSGQYADAAECFSRLLNQNGPGLDRAQILCQLVRCYDALTNYDRTIACAQDYLAQYPHGAEEAEVRFHLALALKQLGRNNESLQQVLLLLQTQNARAAQDPAAWVYWRQRAGNLVANQFYREGDYPQALEIYTRLAELDDSPQWQLPVWYQIGLTYEQLQQPQKAMDLYQRILARQSALGTNAPPDLTSLASMARWRMGFIQWQNRAESINQLLAKTNAVLTAGAAQPLVNHE